MTQDDEIKYSACLVVITGFILGISMGFLDIAVSIFSGPSGFSVFSSILPPLIATTGIFFLIYVVSWFLVVFHLIRFLKIEVIPSAFSLALFLGMLFVLTSLNNLIYFPLPLIELFKLSLLISLSFLTSVGAYFATKAVIRITSYRNAALVFSFVLPFVLAEMVVFLWLQMYRIDSFFSIPSFLACIGYIVIALCVIGLFYRISQKIEGARLLTFSMAFIFVGLLLTLIATKGSKASLEGFKVADHPVKRVILITVDTLRADVLSSYNKRAVSTPHIDQLAKDGILFTKAISPAPWTLPSLASIMTGLSPSVHMVTKQKSKLPDTLPSLAEYMHDAGYFTAAIVHNDYFRPKSNFSQGFLEYHFLQNPLFGGSIGARILQVALPEQFPSPPWPSTSDHTIMVNNWLATNNEKNFFMWIHYYDPHAPSTPPVKYLPNVEPLPSIGTKFTRQRDIISGYFVPSLDERQWIKLLYDGEVRYVDDNIGKLLDNLKRLNLYDESLIVFTSDHGEEFWEHGRHGHGHSLYNELLRVPLIIKLPRSAAKGRIEKVVTTLSIMPTILDLCGIEYGSNYLSADSLSALWGLNPHTFDEQPIISTAQVLFDHQESVIIDGLKYIRSLLNDHEELYVLSRDPDEKDSIVLSFPDDAQRARNILKKHNEKAEKLRKHYRITKSDEIEFDMEKLQRLKALGYIQ